MAFADSQAGAEIKYGESPASVELAGTVKRGDALGYNDGWRQALATSGSVTQFRCVAGSDGVEGQEIVAYFGITLVEGSRFSGATIGGALYVAEGSDNGKYTQTAPSDAGDDDTIIGYALSPTELVLVPNQNIALIANEYGFARTATFVVAASDSSAKSKTQADYVCDGTADDVQIQAAIDALPAGGGKVVLMGGTFNLAAGIVETSDNVHIQGQGIEATKIVPTDTIIAFSFNDTFFGSLNDLSIEAASQQSSGGGVRWYGDSYQMAIRRVRMRNLYDDVLVNCFTAGPAAPRAETGWIEDCIFWDTKNHVFDLNGFTGLFLTGINAWNTTDCIRGIAWQDGNSLWITDCDFMKCGQGFSIYPGVGATAKFLVASGLSLDTCNSYGMIVTGAGAIQFWQINNLHVSTSGLHGIAIYSAAATNHIYFSNPRIISSSDSGIYLSGIRDVLIQGGIIGANNKGDNAAVADQQGIYVVTCDNVRILGVRALNTEPVDGHQKYGVYHASGGSDVIIEDCDLGDNDTGGFYSGDWTKVQVRNNAGFATENSGASSIASGQTTKVVAHGLAATPTVITIAFREQGDNDFGRWWVDTIGATNFTLNVTADPGASNLDFAWEAKVR